MRKVTSESGALIVSIMIIMAFLSTTILSLLVISSANVARATQRIMLLQAQYTAESGADAAIAYLNTNDSFGGTAEKDLITHSPYYAAKYVSTVTSNPAKPYERIIISTGRIYQPANAAAARYTYTVKVVAQRSNNSVTSSLLSRNSVEIASSVKSVFARSLYVNEYIKTNKNVNNIVIDEISVAGKYPDASNCSILGPGNLLRSDALIAAGTKVKVRLANNNCITPPGNTSNADFDVLVNQTNIPKITSTFIPWSYKMNASNANPSNGNGGDYSNGSCNDWTTAAPKIPSIDGSNKTHYPDNSTGIDTNCGTSGDISLGSKTITLNDHAHLRAHLCKVSECTPTFVNPTNDTKFVFVEGVMNFADLSTAGSVGSIVFVSYAGSINFGTPATGCPSNSAAIRIGNNGSDSLEAPKIYLISINGMLCIDKTKFLDNTKALGGISGKDIFLSSNSGANFDLAFNPDFPLNDIPVDLTWRATLLQRVF